MPGLKKILVIQTAFLGDVVLATAILEKLHLFYPHAQLDLMVKKGNESLLTDHPYLHKVYVFDKSNKKKSILNNIKSIRREKYDLLINLQRFFTSGLITLMSGAKETVGFNKNPLSPFFTRRFDHEIEPAKGTHEIERNQKIIARYTDERPEKPTLYPSTKHDEKVKQLKVRPYICIAPSSIWFTKQFPLEKWIEFIDHIKGHQIYLLGAPNDHELCDVIRNSSKNKNVVNLSGKLSLLESAALMKDAVMNFVNDSAPMHLCSATNSPVTAVYCSTIPGFGFGPLSEKSFIVERKESLYCRPCGLHGYKKCPEGHFKCAWTIEINQLLDNLPNE